MAQPSGNIKSLEGATGIRVLSPFTASRTVERKKVCYCGTTLKRLIQKYGQRHVEQVVELLVATGNETELFSATITAVSDLLHEKPKLLDLGGELYERFDGIDLREMRKIAKEIDRNNVTLVLKTILSIRLYEPLKGSTLRWS
jgi:hypothetical protein